MFGGYPNKKENLSKQNIDSIVKFVGFIKIKLKGNRIIKKDPRLSLDFNAFGQNYSVDVIARFLNYKDITSYIVENGGDWRRSLSTRKRQCRQKLVNWY